MPRNGPVGRGKPDVKLYTYWRSTASYRVRIALALKGIAAESAFVHLVRDGGQHRTDGFRAINPQQRVPALDTGAGDILIQSPAIIEYLEETHPEPPLLPADPVERAKARGVAAIISCDIHPLHNVGPLNYLRQTLGQDEAAVSRWISTWMMQGLTAVEARLGDAGYCLGPTPGLADIYLLPQLYAAHRFGVKLDAFPRIRRVEALAGPHPAFMAAHPASQPDAE
jgi:maleylacetoacetate isomerase